MTFIQSIVLGIIQGLTEFLPISSSAHLVILPYLLNWSLDPQKAFFFDVLVQLGTLVAVIAYFWKDLVQIFFAVIEGIKSKAPFKSTESRLGWYIVLGTIPAGLAGLLLKDRVEAAFNSPVLTAVLLFVTAILLVLAEIFSKKEKGLDHLNPLDSVLIGLFQALAIFPGISRSGSTISALLGRGLDKEMAPKLSFLMYLVVSFGVALLGIREFDGSIGVPQLLVMTAASFAVGYGALLLVFSLLRRGQFRAFSPYLWALSAFTLIHLFVTR